MTQTHTPGPWHMVIEAGGVMYINASNDVLARPVATVDSLEDGIDNEARRAEQLANGHLMEAAPELLEGCRQTELLFAEYVATSPDVLSPGYDIAQGIVRCRAAIAKATQ